ncbi:helix-turn-helix domain-containing protein [Kitasatospora sp. NA04385]|uniref:helix-turn-helix domain-containing protein n=1 Tax=Kitasatospora sp. NA04385 TaxID=2742135 RepID=UPI001C378D9F|nr:helix-turn-helix domain-containing protein [Kitasatospora sp. NA04385]
MSSQKKYPVTLSAEDRRALVRVTTTGVRSASMIRRARVLLTLDTSVGEVAPRAVIAERAGVSCDSVRLVSKRYAETGGDVWATIGRKERALPPVPSAVTGEVEARLIALACSGRPRDTPGGRCGCWRSTSRWSRTSRTWTTPRSAGC